MRSLGLKIISLLMWVWFLLSSILLTPFLFLIFALTFWWDKNLKILHLFSCFWGAQYIWMNPLWRLKIEGRGNIPRKGSYIFMSNHQSLVDIVVIYSLFRHFRWTSKEENFKLPFVGWVLSFNRSLKVYRKDINAFEKFRNQALRALREGNSVMVFPEGTRSKTGEPGKFREGAFRIAMETQTGIVPMILDGTARAIPRKGWSMTGRERMKLKVFPPVMPDDFGTSDPGQLMEKIQKFMLEELQKMRTSIHD